MAHIERAETNTCCSFQMPTRVRSVRREPENRGRFSSRFKRRSIFLEHGNVFVYLFRLPVETYRNANDGNHVSVNVRANVSLLERVEFVGSSLEERFIVRLTLIV